MGDDGTIITPGRFVFDLAAPDDDADAMLVIRTHPDTRADEFVIDALGGETVADAAEPAWPREPTPGDYDPDADSVAECVYTSALNDEFGDAWTRWHVDDVIANVAVAGVRSYAYHAGRLEPARLRMDPDAFAIYAIDGGDLFNCPVCETLNNITVNARRCYGCGTEWSAVVDR